MFSTVQIIILHCTDIVVIVSPRQLAIDISAFAIVASDGSWRNLEYILFPCLFRRGHYYALLWFSIPSVHASEPSLFARGTGLMLSCC